MRHSRRELGWTLVELALSLAVLGLVVLGGVWLFQARQTVVLQAQQVDAAAQARDALLMYWRVHKRLPCADTDGDGWEEAACGAIGRLPYKTLGLPTLAVAELRYGVQRALPVGPVDTYDLSERADRFRPSELDPLTLSFAPRSFGHENVVDVCAALTDGKTGAARSQSLAVQAPGGARQAVAAVIVAPGAGDRDGDGGVFDGLNAIASAADPTFESPDFTAEQARRNDDRVVAVAVDDAYQRLGCPAGLGVLGHGHFNTATSAIVIHKSMQDYRQQLQILSDLAGASITSATAGIVSATAGLASAVAASLDAIAWSILTYGAASAAAITAAVADVVTHTIALASAPGALGLAIAGKVEADNRLASSAGLLTQAQALADADGGVPARARFGDQQGF